MIVGDMDDTNMVQTPEAIIDVVTYSIVSEGARSPVVSLELNPTSITTKVRRYDVTISQDSRMADYIQLINKSYQAENDFAKSALERTPSSIARLETELKGPLTSVSQNAKPSTPNSPSTPSSFRRLHRREEPTPVKPRSAAEQSKEEKVKKVINFGDPEIPDHKQGHAREFLIQYYPESAATIKPPAADDSRHRLSQSPFTLENIAMHDEKMSSSPEFMTMRQGAISRLSEGVVEAISKLSEEGVKHKILAPVASQTGITPVEVAKSWASNNSRVRPLNPPNSSGGSSVKNFNSPSGSLSRPEQKGAIKQGGLSQFLPLIVTMTMVGML